MKTSDELRQERSSILDKMEALNERAKDRNFTDDEKAQWSDYEKSVSDLEDRIKREERAEEIASEKAEEIAKARQQQRAKDKPRGGEEKDKRTIVNEYRFTRAMQALLPNGKLEGLEKEMHEEAEREARQSGQTISGVGAPSFLVKLQKRDLVVGTDTAGGHTVATELDGFIEPLTPRLKVLDLGAMLLDGLQGNIAVPRQTSISSATWEGETDANAESEPAFDQVTMTPKRLGAFTEMSKQLLVQSTLGVERLVRSDLSRSIAIALDSAAINGSGSAPIPLGILNTSGIGSVAIGTNGGAITRDHLVKLLAEIETDNADISTLSFLSTPGVKAKLMTTKVDAGSGRFVWEEGSGTLLGYRAESSTQVPSNLTKGTGTNLHAVLFGAWNQLMIGQWSGVDLVLDPYTKAKNAVVNIVINGWYDTAVRHPESFAAIVDADATIS